MSDGARVVDVIPDVVAFITARMNDNEADALMILRAGGGASVLLGMTDFCIAMIMFYADLLGVEPEKIVQTMGAVAGVFAAGRE